MYFCLTNHALRGIIFRHPILRQQATVSPAEERKNTYFHVPFLVMSKGAFDSGHKFHLKEVKQKMPNEKILEAKKAKVAEITELLKNSTSGVLVNYTGISVEDDTKLRKELREAGVKYAVEKNTLLRFAMQEAGLDGLTDVLSGATALAVCDDETTAARILGDYAESHPNFTLKAGFIGTELYDADGVVALSKIPSKEVLLAQLVGSLQGPIQKLAATLQALAEKEETAA